MKNFSETIRNSADIVKIVSEYVSLKGSGDTFKGLCPFHSEKTPSFLVHRDKQYFYCFGCHAGGSVIQFVMQIENVAFPEALRILADKLGIPVPSDPGVDSRQLQERSRLFEINESAAKYFHLALSTEAAAAAKQVLEKRKITPAFVEKFQLGYAPQNGLLSALKPADPVATGLFSRNDRGDVYDRFRHRLMFPIWNDRGKTIAFGGRILGEGDPKYLNSPETPLYTKSNVLYALHLARDVARKAEKLVVVEGYFDCLSLHQNGFENVVASCGTSLTAAQVDLMARYVPEIVMNYDPDAAGQNAMRRSIDLLLAKGLRIRILKLPGGLDPDDFVRQQGREAYGKLLAAAPYFWQYLMSEAMRQFDLSDPAMKGNAVRDVLQFVDRIQDRVERLEVAKAVADGFKVPEAVVYEQLRLTPGKAAVRPRARTASMLPRQLLSDTEKQLIHALLQDHQAAQRIVPHVHEEFFTRIWSYPALAGLARDPERNLEEVLESIEDDELRKQIRAVGFEHRAPVTANEIENSICQLRLDHLVKQEAEVLEQLKSYGSGAAPGELVKRLMGIAAQKLTFVAPKA